MIWWADEADEIYDMMWKTQCHKPTIWGWLKIPPMYSIIGDGLWHWVYHISSLDLLKVIFVFPWVNPLFGKIIGDIFFVTILRTYLMMIPIRMIPSVQSGAPHVLTPRSTSPGLISQWPFWALLLRLTFGSSFCLGHSKKNHVEEGYDMWLALEEFAKDFRKISFLFLIDSGLFGATQRTIQLFCPHQSYLKGWLRQVYGK